MKHPEKTGFIVIFGTGSWMTDEDATSTDIQSIYGVWDDMSNTPLVTRVSANAQLIEQSFEDKDAPKNGKAVGSLTSNAVDYDNTGNASSKVMGWYIDLDVEDESGTVQYPGERAVRDFLIRGGLLFVNTVLPKDPTSCGPAAGGFTLGFDPVTGGASSEPVFDINGDGKFSLTDNISNVDDPDNVVSRFRHDSGTPSDSSFIDNILVTNVSTGTGNGGSTSGDVESMRTNTGSTNGAGRFSWRELIP
jgi:type IV pilus assembly protein PilY1